MSGTSKKLELRMYGLVPYNISPIQQAIQFGHAVVEYGLKYGNTKEYKDWGKNWKTFIILNGGTTNNSLDSLGTLQTHEITLLNLGIKISEFKEPDLNNALTAVVFIVDERVFNKKKYPDYNNNDLILNPPTYGKWLKSIGGVQNANLREFLKQFRLA